MNIPEGWQIIKHDDRVIVVQKPASCGYAASVDPKNIASTTLYLLAKDMLAAAPVPPAGDVEVQRYNTTVSHGGSYEHVVLEEHKNGHVIKSADFDRQVACSTAYRDALRLKLCTTADEVTRLTAERDGLLVKLAEETDRVRIAVEYQQKALRGRDRAQSELTKAREVITGLVRSDSAFRALPEHLRPKAVDIYHQSSPAAKGGE